MRFIVVDDDKSIRKIIKNIIEQNNLGTVVAESEDGHEAEQVIVDLQVDIAIVDLLLPGQDGLEIIKKALHQGVKTKFIMISESDSQNTITQAYQAGIEFFIHKPINVYEIVSVIKNVTETSQLKNFISLISQTTARYTQQLNKVTDVASLGDAKKNKINKIFSELGILGDAGAKNIYQAALLIEKHIYEHDQQYQLADIYGQLGLQFGLDVKTFEQRIRRAITKALQNVANMGVEDYHNDKFQSYSTALFDFKEVRQEMSFIQGKSSYHGKTNIKKFVEGLLFLSIE